MTTADRPYSLDPAIARHFAIVEKAMTSILQITRLLLLTDDLVFESIDQPHGEVTQTVLMKIR